MDVERLETGANTLTFDSREEAWVLLHVVNSLFSSIPKYSRRYNPGIHETERNKAKQATLTRIVKLSETQSVLATEALNKFVEYTETTPKPSVRSIRRTCFNNAPTAHPLIPFTISFAKNP